MGRGLIPQDIPGDVSTSVEAYLALRILDVPTDVRVFTRFYLALFGLFPWDATPQLPAEFIILIPSLVPCQHLQHLVLGAVDDGSAAVDELWVDGSNKTVDLGPELKRSPEHRLEHQEDAGVWAGIIPPMHFGVQALLLEGYTMQSGPVRRALESIERFTWQDAKGKRLQSCVSPVRDTVLMIQGLCNAGVDRHDERLCKAVEWTKKRQILTKGDWIIRRPQLKPGGFGFEYHNTWYPDIDNTAAAILSLIQHDPHAVGSPTVTAAAMWICGMQNADGGFAGFDADNNKLWLNKIPFSDMDSLCDPSTPDCAGHGQTSTPSQTAWALMGLLSICPPDDEAVAEGIWYLVRTQTDRRGEVAASWPETLYTATGFPNFFYMGYSLYRHYFPLTALGRQEVEGAVDSTLLTVIDFSIYK
ncbi:terpenoid cyclases/protein prenyltransferase alpha-alpha toroid [Xylariomycetidae sp. FL2044]|nr:terpenoid cyclases/protein prenyltransferase alpha-alpha toroid [Xylariomycetidae sp. FL2044]